MGNWKWRKDNPDDILFPISYSLFPILFFTALINPNNNLNMIFNSSNTESHSKGSIKPRSLDRSNSVSSSLAEPSAIYRNCTSSLSDRLAEPSAIFKGIEIAARLNCEVIPYFSVDGKEAVSKYSFVTSAKLFFQTSRFWCGFINLHNEHRKVQANVNSFLTDLVRGSNYQFTGKSPITYPIAIGSLFPISHFPFPIPNSYENSIQ